MNSATYARRQDTIREPEHQDLRSEGQIFRDDEIARAWAPDSEKPRSFVCRCMKCGASHNVEEIVCKSCGNDLKALEKLYRGLP